jgi:hypothetical protein
VSLSLLSDVDLSQLFVIVCREHGRTVWPCWNPFACSRWIFPNGNLVESMLVGYYEDGDLLYSLQ